MDIASSFMPLLQVFAVAMTEPTAYSMRQVITGWIFAPRRTVTAALRIVNHDKHHSAYHRVFASARWCVDRVGLAVFDLANQIVSPDVCYLVGDDTLVPRWGSKIYGVGMHRDACNSSRDNHTSFRKGNCWVVLCLLIPSRCDPDRKFALPIMLRLYLNHKTSEKLGRKHRKKTELMLDMLQRIEQHAQERTLHFIGDSAYTGPRMLASMPTRLQVTGRLIGTARLHQKAPSKTGKRGRPARRGPRLPSPYQMLDQKGLSRIKLRLYQHTTYHVRITSVTCRHYFAPEREIKVVAIEHLRGGRGREIFYSTESDLSDADILRIYAGRWPVETTFQDCKGHLGLGDPENRKPMAVRRTTPTIFYLYSLVVLWHEHVREQPGPFIRSWRGKRAPSFADMLATLRRDSLRQTRENIYGNPEIPSEFQKILGPLEKLMALAA